MRPHTEDLTFVDVAPQLALEQEPIVVGEPVAAEAPETVDAANAVELVERRLLPMLQVVQRTVQSDDEPLVGLERDEPLGLEAVPNVGAGAAERFVDGLDPRTGKYAFRRDIVVVACVVREPETRADHSRAVYAVDGGEPG